MLLPGDPCLILSSTSLNPASTRRRPNPSPEWRAGARRMIESISGLAFKNSSFAVYDVKNISCSSPVLLLRIVYVGTINDPTCWDAEVCHHSVPCRMNSSPAASYGAVAVHVAGEATYSIRRHRSCCDRSSPRSNLTSSVLGLSTICRPRLTPESCRNSSSMFGTFSHTQGSNGLTTLRFRDLPLGGI